MPFHPVEQLNSSAGHTLAEFTLPTTADHAHREAPNEFRLEAKLDKILGGNELEKFVIHYPNRLGAESNLALDPAGNAVLVTVTFAFLAFVSADIVQYFPLVRMNQ